MAMKPTSERIRSEDVTVFVSWGELPPKRASVDDLWRVLGMVGAVTWEEGIGGVRYRVEAAEGPFVNEAPTPEDEE